MNNFELINKLYKPYRITKLSKCTIIETMDGKFVIKSKGEKNIKELFEYLNGRGFNDYPDIVDFSRDDFNIYEYIDDGGLPIDQKAQDLIKVVADLHSKTAYTKEIREDKLKEIYEDIKHNLLYYKKIYSDMVLMIEENVFMSPSEYLFIRNSSKLQSQIEFLENKLDEWYEKVRDKREIRVCLIHNNLSLKHFISGRKKALISWDKATIDSPIKDIYNLYRNDGLNVEFGTLLSTYLKYFPLEDDELKLLLIMLCLPIEIKSTKSEFSSCEMLTNALDYVFKTEELVRPYYTEDNKV